MQPDKNDTAEETRDGIGDSFGAGALECLDSKNIFDCLSDVVAPIINDIGRFSRCIHGSIFDPPRDNSSFINCPNEPSSFPLIQFT